jgi:hypothetical protein
LDANYGAHLWFGKVREEIYTAWLAWIFEELALSHYIYDVLGLDERRVLGKYERLQAEVRREVPIPEGKLDLVIRFKEQATIAIEVKVGTADEADTEKQANYLKWLRRERSRVHEPILIATAGEELEYEGFPLRPWNDVCLALRRAAVDVANGRLALAAMILAFVGAVEQNRLHLPGRVSRRLLAGERIAGIGEVGNYLDRWLS